YVLSAASNGQTELIIRHNDFGSAAAFLIVVQSDGGDASRAERVGDVIHRISRKANDVNLLVAQFCHDVLNSDAAGADTGAHRIDISIFGVHGNLGAIAGFTRN